MQTHILTLVVASIILLSMLGLTSFTPAPAQAQSVFDPLPLGWNSEIIGNIGSSENFSISPNGTRIAIGSDRTGNYEIYVMNVDGSNLHRLTYNPYVDKNPSWTPDGSQIVFDSGPVEDKNGYIGSRDILIISADGGEPNNLTNSREIDEAGPSYNSAGDLAYYSRPLDSIDGSVIISSTTSITNSAFLTGDTSNFTWSPDGSRIAMIFADAQQGHAMSAVEWNPTTGDVRDVGANPLYGQISYGPQGVTGVTYDCYMENEQGDIQFDICVGDGPLFDTPERESMPAWSHDGSMLAFVHDDGDGDGGKTLRIETASGIFEGFQAERFGMIEWSPSGDLYFTIENEGLWLVVRLAEPERVYIPLVRR